MSFLAPFARSVAGHSEIIKKGVRRPLRNHIGGANLPQAAAVSGEFISVFVQQNAACKVALLGNMMPQSLIFWGRPQTFRRGSFMRGMSQRLGIAAVWATLVIAGAVAGCSSMSSN